jgi:hypothetical protein
MNPSTNDGLPTDGLKKRLSAGWFYDDAAYKTQCYLRTVYRAVSG